MRQWTGNEPVTVMPNPKGAERDREACRLRSRRMTYQRGLAHPALPDYSGEYAHCVKCGGGIVATAYRATIPTLGWDSCGDRVEATSIVAGGGECMLRICDDCGWAWVEACADAHTTAAAADTQP